MSVMLPDLSRPPLTLLTEEEQLFRETVRQFAADNVAPLVMAMDQAASMDADLVKQLFELGVMAVEVPESMGGAAASFFTAVSERMTTAPRSRARDSACCSSSVPMPMRWCEATTSMSRISATTMP